MNNHNCIWQSNSLQKHYKLLIETFYILSSLFLNFVLQATKRAVAGQRWDYRWQPVPRKCKCVEFGGVFYDRLRVLHLSSLFLWLIITVKLNADNSNQDFSGMWYCNRTTLKYFF